MPQIISCIVARELQFVRMNNDLQLHPLCIYYDMDSTKCICVTVDNRITLYLLWRPQSIVTNLAAYNEVMNDKLYYFVG